MKSRTDLKLQVNKLKKRLRRMRKIVKVGLKTIKERDNKIAQLSSVLDQQNKMSVDDLARKRK